MKISKYSKWIKVDNDVYALYNNILMQIIFVDKKTLNNIIKLDVDEQATKKLIEFGIYVSSDNVLDEIYKKLRSAIKTQTKQLSIMYLNISTFCNLACKYCFIENNPISNNKCQKMSFEVAKISIDKFIREINKTKVEEPQIIIYGGEPLTNYGLVKKIVEYIRKVKRNLTITIITNGTLLRESEIQFLNSNNVGIGISLDGPKFINDKNRVFRNSNKSVYDSAIKAITLLNKNKCNYCVSATVTTDVIKNKEKVYDWIRKVKIKNIFWNLYHYSSFVNKKEWTYFYTNMSDFILEMYNKLDSIGVEEERVKEQLKLFLEQRFKFHNCGAVGLNQITIEPNGDVCICQGDSKSSNNIIGNIVTDEIKDILNNPKNKDWLKMYTIDSKKCKYCEALSICGGGCPLQSEALFSDRKKIDKPTCIYYKASLKWMLKQYYIASLNVEREEVKKC